LSICPFVHKYKAFFLAKLKDAVLHVPFRWAIPVKIADKVDKWTNASQDIEIK